jgi:dTDP-4-amino-4,6-dideoxygalactose transaminase
VDLALQHNSIKEKLLKRVERVISSGLYILGPDVAEFESRFAELCGTDFAVGVDNGTNALILTMRALGIGPGDEVITAANSFLASASTIALAGATPVLVDVRDDYNIDPVCVEKAITSRTKAIMPVHLTGRPADMTLLCDIAKTHDLHLIEDAAQAVGARHAGRSTGSFGVAGCFSLHPLKVLSAVGDGGIITTSDEELCGKLLKARNHGMLNRDECEFWSYNARLDTIQAAMLIVKMEYLENWIEERRSIASHYRQNLDTVVKVPAENPKDTSVYQTFIIQCDRRDELQKYLYSCGVETKVHYPVPIHLQPAARSLGYKSGDFPVTERLSQCILSLPIYPEMTIGQRDHVVRSIRNFYANN